MRINGRVMFQLKKKKPHSFWGFSPVYLVSYQIPARSYILQHVPTHHLHAWFCIIYTDDVWFLSQPVSGLILQCIVSRKFHRLNRVLLSRVPRMFHTAVHYATLCVCDSGCDLFLTDGAVSDVSDLNLHKSIV